MKTGTKSFTTASDEDMVKVIKEMAKTYFETFKPSPSHITFFVTEQAKFLVIQDDDNTKQLIHDLKTELL